MQERNVKVVRRRAIERLTLLSARASWAPRKELGSIPKRSVATLFCISSPESPILAQANPVFETANTRPFSAPGANIHNTTASLRCNSFASAPRRACSAPTVIGWGER